MNLALLSSFGKGVLTVKTQKKIEINYHNVFRPPDDH